MNIPETTLTPDSMPEGFRLIAATPVPAFRAVVYHIEHVATGACILHVHCDDEDNVFSISLPTPPPDDTGMPHILEHSVLAGSRKYPIKEPFFEMLKMSMATFINAMTGYDCTYYPVSSNVPADLFNLADVYFDAVFHPLLSENTFRREAHHLAPADPADPDGALRINGIVYSEMKGAFSDPETRLQRNAVRRLLPDTCYAREFAGDPDAIPSLTHAQLVAFHQSRYHPSNACICLYGNIPTRDSLDFLQSRLAEFQAATPQPLEWRCQPRWTAPREFRDHYPVGADEAINEKTYLAMNWLVGDATDPRDVALLHILTLLLLGHEAAPLREALVRSGLGGDLVLSGAGSAGTDITFHVGIQGTEPDRLDAFRTIVLDTLRRMAAVPVDADALRAAFQQASYHYLEIGSMFPLQTAMQVVDAWVHGADPLTFLRMREHLDVLRQACDADPMYLSNLIRARLVENAHRLDLVLEPDRLWQRRADAALANKMAAVHGGMTVDERRAIAEQAATLERLNGTPNPPEALDRLPQLSVADLPRAPRPIPSREETLAGSVPLLVNDVFSNGILYLELCFDLSGLPVSLWADLPRYIDALDKLGAAGMDYAAMARRVSAETGGIHARLVFDRRVDDHEALRPALHVSLKTLDNRVGPALSVLHDRLFGVDPRDRDRMRDVLLQARTHYRSDFIQDGHVTVRLHAGRGLHPLGHLADCTQGLPQLALSEHRMRAFDREFDPLAERIETIRDFLLNRRRVSASVTGNAQSVKVVRSTLETWLAAMADVPESPEPTGYAPWPQARREGLAAPIQVSHSALLIPGGSTDVGTEPLLAVGAHLVRMDYLLNEVRFKGNAYGAGCDYQPMTGILTLSAYRDPHINRTLAVYRGTADYVRNAPWRQPDIDRAIISVAKHDGKPIRPAEATVMALRRYRTGMTLEWRAARRERLLGATPDAVRRAVLETLESGAGRAALCVMAGRERLETANQTLGEDALDLQNVDLG